MLEAEDYNKEGYGAQDMSAVLAYPAFGLLELGSQMDQGTIAPMMFGLEPMFFGWTPTMSFEGYSFTMANSETTVLEVDRGGGLEIVDAVFEWDDHTVTITATSTNCSAVSAAPVLQRPEPPAPRDAPTQAADSSGCGCTTQAGGSVPGIAVLVLFGLGLGTQRRRRHRRYGC